MDEADLRRYADQTVSTILRELQGSIDGLPEQSAWLGELSNQVHQVIRRDLPFCANGSQIPSGLAEELALTTYLTLATAVPKLELTPAVLLRLGRRLSQPVSDLGSRTEPVKSQGGKR